MTTVCDCSNDVIIYLLFFPKSIYRIRFVKNIYGVHYKNKKNEIFSLFLLMQLIRIIRRTPNRENDLISQVINNGVDKPTTIAFVGNFFALSYTSLSFSPPGTDDGYDSPVFIQPVVNKNDFLLFFFFI